MNDQLRDAAFRAGVWQFIEQRAKAMKDQAREELRGLEPGDSVAGKWHGQTVAKATMTDPDPKISVRNGDQFLEWVRSHHGTEIVESVNPAFMNTLKIVDGFVIDKDGEPVCGVEVVPGKPFVSVRKSDGAEAIIAELFRTGSVGLNGIASAPLPPIVDPAHLDELPVTRWVEDMEAGAIG
jgi:hypothetical protein